MTSEYNIREKAGRIRPRPSRHPRKSFEIPERLRHGEDEDEDVTASKDPRYAQRSIFDLITHAGSVANLRSRFTHDELSESEEEQDHPAVNRSSQPPPVAAAAAQPSQQAVGTQSKHRHSFSDRKILRPLQKLHIRSPKNRNAHADDAMSSSQILTPKPPIPEQVHVEKMEEDVRAKAGMEASAFGSDLRKAHESFGVGPPPIKDQGHLAQRLMEIFQLEEEEKVISGTFGLPICVQPRLTSTEFPCWLLQTVLLQGYLYITEKHICFYAYLPKKAVCRHASPEGPHLANTTQKDITKSGYLSKRGRTMWNRSWFILKGDVLAYFNDPTNLYFPRGRINLRYALSAVLIESKDKTKDPMDFSVTTNQKTYVFRADSAASAKEWVKLLQKVIFKSHNDGDSVKIAIPMDNVVEIEENPVLDYAETIKVGVVDNDDSYAVDDYFFSFFGFGQEALNVMRVLVEGSKQQADSETERPTTPENRSRLKSPVSPHGRTSSSPVRSTIFQPAAATLSPASASFRQRSSSRVSGESRRSSFDRKRNSVDRGRRSLSMGNKRYSAGPGQSERFGLSPVSSGVRDSSESACLSLEPDEVSSAAIQSINETDASASQVLNRSDVFHRPSAGLQNTDLMDSDVNPRGSQDTARSTDLKRKQYPYPKTEQTISTRSRTPIQGSKELGETSELRDDRMQASGSGYYSGLVNAGTLPFAKASGIAGYIRKNTMALGNRLTTDTMGYVEKVSGMWAGGRKHYGEDGYLGDEEAREVVDDEDAVSHNERFRQHFALPDNERLRATFFCNLWRVLPQYGKIYLSDRYFCFRSLLPGTRTKVCYSF